MKKTVFFLVRHGEAEHNILDVASSFPEQRVYHLTDEGRRQVVARAEELSRESIDVIFFSPITRTRETAIVIAEKTGAPSFEDMRLREPGYGIFEDGSLIALTAKYPPPRRRLETDGMDGVENFAIVRDRLVSFRDFVLSEHRGERIVVISHGDTLQLLHGILAGLTLEESVLSENRHRFHRGEMLKAEI